MRNSRARPFSTQQLGILERQQFGEHDGTIRRLIETIRAIEVQNNTERLDELAAENARLRSQLERLAANCEHYRVLIVANFDKTIDVYADPQVRVQTVCLPETSTTEEFNAACEWALAQLPHEFQGIIDDIGIKPNLYSVQCMDRIHWRYYHDRLKALADIEQIADTIEEIKNQPASDDTYF